MNDAKKLIFKLAVVTSLISEYLHYRNDWLTFTVSAMVQGYHVYKEIWKPEVHEELRCEREVGNRSDTFAVTVKK